MRTPLSSVSRTSGQLSLIALVAGITVVAAVQGCTGNIGLVPGSTGTDTETTTSAGPGGDAGTQTPEEMFAALLPEMKKWCGGCHTGGAQSFLAPPDEYESIKAYDGIVIKQWQGSKLLSFATGAEHETKGGTNIDNDGPAQTLLPQVKQWLEAEAKRLPDPDPGVQRVGPFPVNTKGFNSFYFGGLGEEFKDIALTFTASDATGQLTLTNMQVNPSKSTGVHLVHPTFQVFESGSDTPKNDSADTFATFDASYQPNQTGPFTDQPFVLADWTPGAQVGIIFDTFEVIQQGGGGTGCAAVDSFTTNAAPLLQTSCAANCHGGGNATAQGAMDLAGLGTDNAAVCDIVLNRVNLTDPLMSQIFRNSDPNDLGAAHDFKFGTVEEFDAFRTSVTLWITAE